MSVLNLIVDVLFWSIIDGLFIYLVLITMNNEIEIDKDKLIINSMMFGMILGLMPYLLPIVGFSQIAMGVGVGIAFHFMKGYDLKLVLHQSVIILFLMSLFEYLMVKAYEIIIGVNIFDLSFVATDRVVLYIILKFIEFTFVFIWRYTRMKVVVGSTSRR